jgi:hypothetical protein
MRKGGDAFDDMVDRAGEIGLSCKEVEPQPGKATFHHRPRTLLPIQNRPISDLNHAKLGASTNLTSMNIMQTFSPPIF